MDKRVFGGELLLLTIRPKRAQSLTGCIFLTPADEVSLFSLARRRTLISKNSRAAVLPHSTVFSFFLLLLRCLSVFLRWTLAPNHRSVFEKTLASVITSHP